MVRGWAVEWLKCCRVEVLQEELDVYVNGVIVQRQAFEGLKC